MASLGVVEWQAFHTLLFLPVMWCDSTDNNVRRVDYYIILEPTMVDNILFLSVQRCASTHDTRACPPSHLAMCTS
jgi:hypothetical protein